MHAYERGKDCNGKRACSRAGLEKDEELHFVQIDIGFHRPTIWIFA